MKPNLEQRQRQTQIIDKVRNTRSRIEHWRATRQKRGHMPAELWAEAALLASEHGLWAVSQALRVNYQHLKSRVSSPTPRGSQRKRPTKAKATRATVAGFVGIDAAQLINSPGQATTVVELSSAAGEKLQVRVEGGNALDVPALLATFWQHNR